MTGTSVLGIRYKDGVMVIADTLASYGSMARFNKVERIAEINENTLIAASGEYSDYQQLKKDLHSITYVLIYSSLLALNF